jgi:hypothetical protein
MAQVIGQAAPVSPVGSVIGAHLGSSDDTVAFVVVGKLRKK